MKSSELITRAAKLLESNQFAQAAQAFHAAATANPSEPAALVGLGISLSGLGRTEEAKGCLGKALSLDPKNAMALDNLGVILLESGEIAAAENCFIKAVAADPSLVVAHFNLSQLKRYTSEDPQLTQMEALYRASSSTKLCFALGKAYEDLGRVDDAFSMYAEGNRLRANELSYSLAKDQELAAEIRAFFAEPVQPATVTKSPRPIFIVGMPRSGTTLVEQIIASHSMVHGAGELGIIGGTCKLALSRKDRGFAEPVRHAYLTTTKSPKSIITDKMPSNFLWIGFILSAFPEAKIVATERDPMAVGWSLYKSCFATGIGYKNSFADIGGFYSIHREMMEFWHRKFPGQIYTVDYERLTTHQEQETRALLDYCGLDFEPSCLAFHETKRPVKTLSRLQVSRPMYTGSSQSWRAFERHLDPLRVALGIKK